MKEKGETELSRARVLITTLAGLLLLACGGGSAPSGGSSPQPNAGSVAFVSSQGSPAQETQDMNQKVLPGFHGSASFLSQATEQQDIDKVLAEQKAGGTGTIDVLGLTHGAFATLQGSGALMDLTPLLQKLQKDRTFPASLLTFGKLGTQQQLYIPWIQATYMLVVNKKADQYLPKGVDKSSMTYDQLIAWAAAVEKGTGEKLFGLPAAPGASGGLLNRFIQGYTYPAYTGTEITNFRSPEAVQMWEMVKKLWTVSNPQSTTYAQMEDPLQSGEVWMSWDHVARFQNALATMGDQFEILPAPSGPKGLSYITALIGLGIPKNAPNKAGAEALIDYLTQPRQQALTATALSFLPVVQGVNLSGPGVPAYLSTEAAVAQKYATSKNAIAAWLEVGLGTQSNTLKLAYQDAFTRIILRNEDIQTTIDYEAGVIQRALDTANAPCWRPDPPSTGTCQIK
jgi:multiple sugar transport system substrate-binding protein